MKKIILLLLLILNFEAWAIEHKSLSCSKNGTDIIFINGIRTSQEKTGFYAQEIQKALNDFRDKYDNKSNIQVFPEYNSSEGLFRDAYQLIKQKLAGQKRFSEEKIVLLVPLFFFKIWEFQDEVGTPLFQDILGEFYFESTKQKYISMYDVRRMASRIKNKLDSNSKVIVVSHSQGNIYANLVYDELLMMGVPAEKLDKFYGNLQIGSVASSIRAKNSRLITYRQDLAVNLLRLRSPQIMNGNYSLYNPASCTLSFDLCHDFANNYLSTSFSGVGPNQRKLTKIRSGVEIFQDNLEEIAWMLANNDDSEECCNGEDGRFYRKDYESETGGFVEKIVQIEKTKLLLDEASFVCGNVKIGEKNVQSDINIQNSKIRTNTSIDLRGKIHVRDSDIQNFCDDPCIPKALIMNADASVSMIIDNTDIYGHPTISGSLLIVNSLINDGPAISGTAFTLPPNVPIPSGATSRTLHPTIIGNKVWGDDTLISGFYTINRDVYNSTIAGSTIVRGNEWNLLNFDASSWILHGVNAQGYGYIGGDIGYGVTLNGYAVDDAFGGIGTAPGTKVHGSSSLSGTMVMDSATEFQGSWTGNATKSGIWVSHASSSLLSGPFSISGAARIIGSEIYQGSISGVALVSGSSLISPTISCNAVVTGETGVGRSFGCGYVSSKIDEETKKSNEKMLKLQRSKRDEFVAWNLNYQEQFK